MDPAGILADTKICTRGRYLKMIKKIGGKSNERIVNRLNER